MAGEGAPFAVPRPGWRAGLALVLAVAVVGVLLAARLGGAEEPSVVAPATPPATTATATASQSPLPDDGVSGPDDTPYKQRPAAAALTAAEAFVRAWVHHPPDITAAAWWRAVSAHADPGLAEQLRFTDPQRVPATAVTGRATGIAGGVSSASVAVPTDAGRVVLTCVLIDGRWLVSDVDLERAER